MGGVAGVAEDLETVPLVELGEASAFDRGVVERG